LMAGGLQCSMSAGRTGSSGFGYLALVGLGVTVWRRRRSSQSSHAGGHGTQHVSSA
jgi:MYXO-CTERM domain-containing protein